MAERWQEFCEKARAQGNHYEDRLIAAGLMACNRIDALEAEVERLREQKDGAYRERDALVAALSKVFPSHLMRHPESDESWEDDWRWIVCVLLPAGQATWHIHDSELPMFDHLTRAPENTWDGHDTGEKYRRLAALKGDA